jgi:NADH/NAD ratio-sensing transcriptional regulator Rex
MTQKLMPRLGSAIASTILSVFGAVSLVGVDKAQAAVLTYNFDAEGQASGFFKVDDSSVTGIEVEGIAVSQGRL